MQATLQDAVATEASVAFAGIKIPIGFFVSVLGRLARGPRIVGSLHYTDGTGGPILTAQIVGPGKPLQWRVDAPAETERDKSVLDQMVAELAIRIFNDLTLSGSLRWRAIRAFTEHLDLYRQAYRMPRDRALKLEQAEAKLLEAIAEDEGFDLAYYNLGVVYAQLADTELAAAQSSGYLQPGDEPAAAYDARLEAALVAFNRAVALNRDRAEAVYALAVHEFTRHRSSNRALEAVVCRCERVLELQPDHTQAHELMAMAQIQLGENGEPSLRTAVRQSWRRLWRLEFRERSAPPTVDSLLPGARANLAAALGTLAQYNLDHADGPRRLARADRLFRRASDLATGDTKAATLLAYGRMLEQIGRAKDAVEPYHSALKIDPENPVFWAHLAVAYASPRTWNAGEDPETFVEGALNDLAPIYRRIKEPYPTVSAIAMRNQTLGALSRVYAALGDRAGSSRVAGMVTLAYELEKATCALDVPALKELKARYGEDRAWEREQVQIALARTLGRLDAWAEAAQEYEELIEMLERLRPDGLVQHSLRAKLARALREQKNRLEDALVAATDGERQNPLSACARRELGEVHFALSQFDLALAAWKQTMWLTPNDPHLHWKVAFCHWKVAQERHDEATRRAALLDAAGCFEQAARLFGTRADEWAWSQLWAGRARQELGEADAALSRLRSAAGRQATALPAQLLLGEVYGSVGDVDAARRELGAVLERLTPCSGRVLDAGWGDTLRDHEAAGRARAALTAGGAAPSGLVAVRA